MKSMHFVCDFTQKVVATVFDTLLNLKVDPVSHMEGADIPQDRLVGMVGSVSFAGKIAGSLHTAYSKSLACNLAGCLIGAKPKSWFESDVSHLIGKIANTVGGDTRRRTAEPGFTGQLAPPLIMRGDNTAVESKDTHGVAENCFRFPEVKEERRVRVIAKLEP